METQPQKRALSAFLPHERGKERERSSSLRGTKDKIAASPGAEELQEGKEREEETSGSKEQPHIPGFHVQHK